MITWCYAGEWSGRVWLDGIEQAWVSAVAFDGERAFAIERFVLGPDGRPRLTPSGDAEREIMAGGDIRVELRRHRPEAEA